MFRNRTLHKAMLFVALTLCMRSPAVGHAKEDTVSMERVEVYYDDCSGKPFVPTKKERKSAKSLWNTLTKAKPGQTVAITNGKYPKLTKLWGIIEEKYLGYYDLSGRAEQDGHHITYWVNGKDIRKAVYYNRAIEEKLKDMSHEMGISKNTSKRDAIVQIHNYVCAFLTYDPASFDYENEYEKYTQIMTGRGVCEDYAILFQALAKMHGIDCGLVSDFASDHAYNVVLMEGEKLYFDATWDDAMGCDKYMFLPQEEIKKDHGISLVQW